MSTQFEYKSFRRQWDTLLERRKYKEAEKLCHEGLAQSPMDQARGKLYNHLGYLYENFLDDKTFDDILEHYVLSLQVDETNANSHYNLSNFLLEQGMQHLLRALELNPSHSKATKRFTNLTPIKINQTLLLGKVKYQVTELTDDGVHAVLLRMRDDGSGLYERTNEEYDIQIGGPLKTAAAARTNSAISSNVGNQNAGNVSSMSNYTNANSNALEIEQPNSRGAHNINNDNNSCCARCSLAWYVWLVFWILAVGGVAMPVLSYTMDFFQECETEIEVSTSTLNTANELSVAIFLDCGADTANEEFRQQLNVTYNLLNTFVTAEQLAATAVIYQYCASELVISKNQTSSITSEWLSSISNIDQRNALPNNTMINTPLDECQRLSTSTPLSWLCIIMVAVDDPVYYDSITTPIETVSEQTDSDVTLLAFVTLESVSPDASLFLFLDKLASYSGGVDTISSWSTLDFSDSVAGLYCGHCVNYEVGGEQQITNMAGNISVVFESDIKARTYSQGDDKCEPIDLYLYMIGGVVPLLIWVLVVMILLCSNKCKKNSNQAMEGAKQSEYV